MPDIKRSPHKARLSRNAASVLARNLRVQLAEEIGLGDLPHQECLGIVARMAGYENLHHLAANYVPDAPDAGEVDADAALAGRPFEIGMDDDAWIRANHNELGSDLLAIFFLDKSLLSRGRDWLPAARVLRRLGATPKAFAAIACIVGDSVAVDLRVHLGATALLAERGSVLARAASRDPNRNPPWMRYYYAALLVKEMDRLKTAESMHLQTMVVRTASELLRGEPLKETFGDTVLGEVCAAIHAVAMAGDVPEAAVDRAFQQLTDAFPRHAAALTAVRRDPSLRLSDALLASGAKPTLPGTLLLVYGRSNTGKTTRSRWHAEHGDAAWLNVGEIRTPQDVLDVLDRIHDGGVVGNIHAMDPVAACGRLLSLAEEVGVALDGITLRFEPAPLHNPPPALHLTPREAVAIQSFRSIETAAEAMEAARDRDPGMRFAIHGGVDLIHLMKELRQRFPDLEYVALDARKLGFSSPEPDAEGRPDKIRPMVMAYRKGQTMAAPFDRVQHLVIAG